MNTWDQAYLQQLQASNKHHHWFNSWHSSKSTEKGGIKSQPCLTSSYV